MAAAASTTVSAAPTPAAAAAAAGASTGAEYAKVPIARLQCAVQHYDWGKRGSASAVARLHHADAAKHVPIDEKKPYAELWMGTHKSAPSNVFVAGASTSSTVPLRQWLGGAELPYLFKVLSVATALSIQAHPTKAHGAHLHSIKPQMYPDPNHKPEMTVAVTRFEALCGFRPLSQVCGFLKTVPELRALVGDAVATQFEAVAAAAAAAEAAAAAAPAGAAASATAGAAAAAAAGAAASGSSDAAAAASAATVAATASPWVAGAPMPPAAEKAALQTLFGAVMTADTALVTAQLSALVKRLKALPAVTVAADAKDVEINGLILRLSEQYPNDVGIFCPLLLNAIVLNVGDAIFLPANEPHAYLSGDCIEAMAASDNVVRAGLTPKFRDVSVLVDMLTYRADRPPVHSGTAVDRCTRLYLPPVPEFMCTSTCVAAGAAEYTLKGVSGTSIAVVLSGCGTLTPVGGAGASAAIHVGAGSIVAIRDAVDIVVSSGGAGGAAAGAKGSTEPLLFFRCSPNSLLGSANKSHL